MSGEKPRIELSAVQVLGGALAAASAAVAASLLGVAGTVIGAVVASIVTTVGGAMYTHSMRRGKDVLQRARTAHLTQPHRLPARRPEPAESAQGAEPSGTEQATGPGDAVEPEEKGEPNDATDASDREQSDEATGRRGWRDRFRALDARTVAISAACALVLALGVITGVEALIGKPISSALGGGKQHGTSIGSLADGGQRNTPGTKRTPHHSATPTATPTGTVTETQSPSRTPTRAPLRPSQAPSTSRPASTSSTSHAPTSAPTRSPGASKHTVPGGVLP